MKERTICRGDLFYYDFGNRTGSIQSGERPVLVIQADDYNKNAPTIIVAAVTSVIKKRYLPSHILLGEDFGLKKPSMVLLEQVQTVNKEDLKDYAGMTVTRASDGKEVVDLFKNHPRGTYDLILMDIMMPNMDGHQAAKAIRALGIERSDAVTIPIIALSANAFIDDIQESLDLGICTSGIAAILYASLLKNANL